MTAPRLLGAAAALALSALALSGCAGAPEATPEPTTSSAPTEVAAPEPTTSSKPAPTAAADPTCETLIPADVVADYESVGVTSQQSPMYIGSTEVKNGILCMWANFDQPASDSGQIYGWAKLSDAAAKDAQDELVDEGWVLEEADDAVYVTESPDTALVTDDDGYGMTYLFADGQVKVADTKQGLLLIEWPKG
ncbi:hypothetical protein IF188_08090 [Microbacterium sp. NEAU-LLC]|uniref:Nitrate ABC transporter substrate-binding protein n=1 Tax=Microbacterium helvum TaxID=2773713 RepID=A0ABR8NLW5_9MICO|nr:hypothetical protein [Microbacterium helvum]MBD3941652.1 hypothetical protein [Microbacterium helvum]